MSQITITEALAELNTISKRLEKKREAYYAFLTRQEGLRDPLEKQGGSPKVLSEGLQSIRDLEKRKVAIRTAIQLSNLKTEITIAGVTKTVAEWLTWRKEVAPDQQRFLATVSSKIQQVRVAATRAGGAVVSATVNVEAKPQDYVVNVDEAQLVKDVELLEETLGTLDGQLSLRNATVLIEV